MALGRLRLMRPSAEKYRCQLLADLARQLFYAPPERRIKQVLRAEQLHDQIDPARNYPFDYLSYRITGYRTEDTPSTLLVGDAILPDLRLLIDRLSRSAPIQDDGQDPTESTEALAARLGVSTKTIGRWRRLGLRWRWVRPTGAGRKRIGYATAAVDHFLERNATVVARASRFTVMDDDTRQRVVDRARRIVQAHEFSLNQVAEHLAGKLKRSNQAIRNILEEHDRSHPDTAVFVGRSGPLSKEQKRGIVRAFRGGTRVGELTRRYRRTRATIYRVVHDRRAAAIRRLRIGLVDVPLFHRDDAEDTILKQPAPAETRKDRRKPTAVDDLPVELQAWFVGPPLTGAIQLEMLTRYNFLKFLACRQREKLDPYNPRAADLDRIVSWVRQAAELRRALVMGVLPLIPPVARRHMHGEEDRSPGRLIELIEACCPLAIEAVDRFDGIPTRPFEAYVTWRLMQSLAGSRDLETGRARARRRLRPGDAAREIQRITAGYGIRLPIEKPSGKGEG